MFKKKKLCVPSKEKLRGRSTQHSKKIKRFIFFYRGKKRLVEKKVGEKRVGKKVEKIWKNFYLRKMKKMTKIKKDYKIKKMKKNI
ncbi:hypothetical protein RFI_38448 [Reticulomyxa filosa]|uniref:Uncharacterized protein n=1 Tax=Reticulomyxa filosa TaxID=46433 RepID=X6LBX5_RETFI|nr:hypothetical protein RFI_38448 [Reticulomyxa filosa]|eukprot:ETN99038.1 hypothetical protein RFI_38448 [Reticulomyxa filosa]